MSSFGNDAGTGSSRSDLALRDRAETLKMALNGRQIILHENQRTPLLLRFQYPGVQIAPSQAFLR
jgi:hypothetical protein